MRFVKHLEDKNSESKHEIYKDDIATDKMASVVESVPYKNQKVLKVKLEGGDTIIIPVEIIETSLKPGEKSLVGKDEDGDEKIRLTVYNDGKIEIKNLTTEDLVKLIKDMSDNLQSAITDLISATVPTSLGPQSLSVAVAWAVPLTGLLAKTAENATKINNYKK